jgi:2-dehydro-3-deoxyphosphooctonate aldolase (KDO 8-P synthase)
LTISPDNDVPSSRPAASPTPAPITFGDGRLAILAGPCLAESRALVFEVAESLRETCARLELPFVFKASFDKANRTSGESFRSIGFAAALALLGEVRETFGVPIVTDVHESWQVPAVAEVADVIQIPAFLCRQTDLLTAAGASGCVVNVKKGQFLAPEDMRFAVDKVRGAGGDTVLLTERGSTFGYRDLVVDFRSLAIMREYAPVVFDATHSVQSPGGAGGKSGGRREFVAPLARAAMAFGVDALFIETHPDPDQAASDGPNQLPLDAIGDLLEDCLAVRGAVEPRTST